MWTRGEEENEGLHQVAHLVLTIYDCGASGRPAPEAGGRECGGAPVETQPCFPVRCQNQTQDGLKISEGQKEGPLTSRNHHDEPEDTLLLENTSGPASQILNGSTEEARSEKLNTISSELACLPPPEVCSFSSFSQKFAKRIQLSNYKSHCRATLGI